MKAATWMSKPAYWAALPSFFLFAALAHAEDVRVSISDGIDADVVQTTYCGSAKEEGAKGSCSDKDDACVSAKCGAAACVTDCIPNEPWTMPQPCLLQNLGFKIGGWVQQGVTFNPHNPANGFNGVLGTNEQYQWAYNHADNWNGGGMHFSNDYGFGLVDAHAAVRLAESWTERSTSAMRPLKPTHPQTLTSNNG